MALFQSALWLAGAQMKPLKFCSGHFAKMDMTTSSFVRQLLDITRPARKFRAPADLVEQLCQKFPNILIAVDEAYEEFSSSESYIPKTSNYPNLIVMRTLSKAYALAGVRGGVAIADPRVIKLMLKVLPPYPIAKPVENAILDALSPAAMSTHAARLLEWKDQRERMFTQLQNSPFIKKVWPSDANFLLIDVQDDDALMRELDRRQVKIRDYRSTTGHMRISIGSPEENTIALSAFGVKVKPKRPDRIGEMHRRTKETDISVRVNLDDAKLIKVDTGIGFYDHMLEALAKHGNFGLTLSCNGDLIQIDVEGENTHHMIEASFKGVARALRPAFARSGTDIASTKGVI